jgi:hypothetical protein
MSPTAAREAIAAGVAESAGVRAEVAGKARGVLATFAGRDPPAP